MPGACCVAWIAQDSDEADGRRVADSFAYPAQGPRAVFTHDGIGIGQRPLQGRCRHDMPDLAQRERRRSPDMFGRIVKQARETGGDHARIARGGLHLTTHGHGDAQDKHAPGDDQGNGKMRLLQEHGRAIR